MSLRMRIRVTTQGQSNPTILSSFESECDALAGKEFRDQFHTAFNSISSACVSMNYIMSRIILCFIYPLCVRIPHSCVRDQNFHKNRRRMQSEVQEI